MVRLRLWGITQGLLRWRVVRKLLLPFVTTLEGGIFFSETWREVARRYYGVIIGAYTYGPDLKPWSFPPGTVVGRYCSIAEGVLVLRRNHPVDFPSQHPFFFNKRCGVLDEDRIPSVSANPLVIGNDVWIGSRVIILPGCKRIGDGAIVGAGSLVTRDIPPFAIVGGVPARLIRSRFEPPIQRIVAASRWWERSLEELIAHLDLFTKPLSGKNVERFKAAFL